MHVRAGIVVFPGSNCDRDMMHVLRDVYGIDAQFFWHEKPLPKSGLDALKKILPLLTHNRLAWRLHPLACVFQKILLWTIFATSSASTNTCHVRGCLVV